MKFCHINENKKSGGKNMNAENFEFYSDEHINKLQTYIKENFEMDGCSTTLINNILNFATESEDDESALRVLEKLLDGIGITRKEIINAVVI